MGRSNLTVVADAEKNPTPWKAEAGGLVPVGRGDKGYVMARHPAGSALRSPDSTEILLSKLQENRNDIHRSRLRAMHAQVISDLDAELQGTIRQHETETLLLDYRLAGHTLEELGEIGDDEVVSEAWARLSEDFEL